MVRAPVQGLLRHVDEHEIVQVDSGRNGEGLLGSLKHAEADQGGRIERWIAGQLFACPDEPAACAGVRWMTKGAEWPNPVAHIERPTHLRAGARRIRNRSDGDHYFGRPRSSEYPRSWFKAALVAAGLERMTIHDLRHTAASLAISSGADVKAVQRMLGHASAAMTLGVYADLFDDDLDTVSASLNAARNAAIGR